MKVICIDDEKLALQFMQHLLNRIDDVNVVGAFQNPMEAFEFVKENNVDVIFLDIHMPEIDGIELAEKIIEKKPQIDIVFVTAYNEYAVTAFELNALDYLMKPVKQSRIKQTIDRLKSKPLSTDGQPKREKVFKIRLEKNLTYSIDGEEYKPFKWRTAKARELFLYLLQNENTIVHKGTILDLLWSDLDLDRGFSILYTTVYNVRKTLQQFQEHFELTNTNDGYMLKPNHVKVDVQVWEEKLEQLPALTEESVDQYEATMNLSKAPYLADYDYIWIESEKQRLENLWLDYAQQIAAFYDEHHDLPNVIQWYQKMIERVPELEEAHFMLMKMYAKLGRIKLVKHQYEYYLKIQENFGLDADPTIEKWYNNFCEAH